MRRLLVLYLILKLYDYSYIGLEKSQELSVKFVLVSSPLHRGKDIMDNEEFLRCLSREESRIKFYLTKRLPYYEDIPARFQEVVDYSFEFSLRIKDEEKLPAAVWRIANAVIARYYKDPDNHRNNHTRVVSSEECPDYTRYESKGNQPDERLEKKELASAVWRTISLLSPSYAAVLSLKELEGYSYEEIGSCLGISITQVRGLLYRARKELKRLAIKGNLQEFLYQ